jgi:hypothetical protein
MKTFRELLGIGRPATGGRPKSPMQWPGHLSERELNAALANLEVTHPAWVALLQLIDTARENALENADQNMDPPTILAGYVGGAAHLKLLGDELHYRRELGLVQREEQPATRDKWLRQHQVEPPAAT